MNRARMIIVVAGLAIFQTQAAECVYPQAPATLPDGKTASKEEMLTAAQAVKTYNTEVNEYLACLETETQAGIEAAGPDASKDTIEQIKSVQAKRHNAAVEELESRAADFNEQVRAFKKREKR